MFNVDIKKEMFNEVFLQAFEWSCRFMIFYGGAGSGKSYFVVSLLIVWLMQKPLMNLLVVRNTSDSNRHSTFALFCQIIHGWNLEPLFKINKSDMTITCVNGNSVLFKGLDDPEKLKSITFNRGIMTDIWIEEASEISEEAFNQLNVRLRGMPEIEKHIILTFNPIFVTHWLKARFFDKKQDDVKILHTTYKDNRFIDASYKVQLEAFRESDPYYYAVYCLGEWGVLGKTVFDARNVHTRLSKNVQPVSVGRFYYTIENNVVSNIEFREEEDGFIKIYKAPKKGYPYVVGGDTAGEGSDFFTAQVLDNTTGEQVAVLHQETDEDLYAEQLYCLGMYYNKALLAPERNFSTHPIHVLEDLKYPNMFVQVDEDRFTHKVKPVLGFTTTRSSRPYIIAELVKVMRDTPELISDRLTLEEMLTFVRNEKGRPEAQEGMHDDLIMALAIAFYLRSYQSTAVPGLKPQKAEWEDDIWVDYYNADDEGKEFIIKKYGNPF